MKKFFGFSITTTLGLATLLTMSSSIAQANSHSCTDGLSQFRLDPPKGWKFDTELAQSLGTCVFFYPPDAKLESSPAVIYARAVSRPQDPKINTIEAMIKEDFDLLRVRSPLIYQRDKGLYRSKKKIEFKVVRFLNGPKNQEFDSNAYLKVGDSILVVSLSTSTRENFDKYLPLWIEVLNSVIITSSPPPKKILAPKPIPSKNKVAIPPKTAPKMQKAPQGRSFQKK
ncbi:MAG: hypothetical protein K2Q26_07055 [Bdellovibrionales bacterium]|nr:hypothetical protein [Bdellovibrionales bacterium]